jgi:hypothetical protein
MSRAPEPGRSGTSDDPPQGTATVSASLAIRAPADVVCAVLADPAWLGRRIGSPTDRPEHRRIETDLAFTLPSEARTLTFRKAAFVDIGPVIRDGGVCVVEIGWRAATMAPLFPVFAGRLGVADGLLRLEGLYAPPGGGIGVLVDRALLHFVAKRTAVWFLERVAGHASALPSVDRDG